MVAQQEVRAEAKQPSIRERRQDLLARFETALPTAAPHLVKRYTQAISHLRVELGREIPSLAPSGTLLQEDTDHSNGAFTVPTLRVVEVTRYSEAQRLAFRTYLASKHGVFFQPREREREVPVMDDGRLRNLVLPEDMEFATGLVVCLTDFLEGESMFDRWGMNETMRIDWNNTLYEREPELYRF